MSNDNGPVKFLMPDGSEVSNDLDWQREQAKTARESYYDSIPNTGTVGAAPALEDAQRGAGLDPLQSGQAGVEVDYTGGLGPAMGQADPSDVDNAQENGYSAADPKSAPVTTDNNEAVVALQKAMSNLEAAGEGEGDPDTPMSEWSVKQLKAELAKRNADGRDDDAKLKITKGMKRDDLAKMLEEDSESDGDDGEGEGEGENPSASTES